MDIDILSFIIGALVALVSTDIHRRATEWLEKHPARHIQRTGKRRWQPLKGR